MVKPNEVMVKPAVVMVILRNHLVARPHHMVA